MKNQSEDYWRRVLTKQQYFILRKKGTEPAFSGEYLYNVEKGEYVCAACKQPLFSSKTKYKSGSGWPSYYSPINEVCILKKQDYSYGLNRTEVLCSNCNGHLGHVFQDEHTPTGLRYCINSAALLFIKE